MSEYDNSKLARGQEVRVFDVEVAGVPARHPAGGWTGWIETVSGRHGRARVRYSGEEELFQLDTRKRTGPHGFRYFLTLDEIDPQVPGWAQKAARDAVSAAGGALIAAMEAAGEDYTDNDLWRRRRSQFMSLLAAEAQQLAAPRPGA